MNVKNNQDCVLIPFLHNPKAAFQVMSYFHIKMILLPGLLIVCMSGCGCLLGGGGDTTRADRLNHVHKEVGFGIGGPGWWALKRLGTSLSEDENRAATLAIRGVKSVQVSRFTLDQSSEAHKAEIFDLYADLMRQKKWNLITRVYEDRQSSCIYAKYNANRFRGIFIVVIEANEMHVVRIVCDIRPEFFAELNTNLGQYGVRLPASESE